MISHSRPYYGPRDMAAVQRTVSRSFTGKDGPECDALRDELAGRYGCRDLLLTASGKEAIKAALAVCGVGPGDHVVVPAYICYEVMEAILDRGGVPVLADIDPGTYMLDPDSIERVLTDKVRVIIAAHLFGIPGDIREIVSRFGSEFMIIEDIAQAVGATTPVGEAGTFGHLAVLSFGAIKMVGADEGGALLCNGRSAEISAAIRRRYTGLSDLSAALVRSQYAQLDRFIDRRKEVALRYRTAICNDTLALPRSDPGGVWYRFPLTLRKRGSLVRIRSYFEGQGIQVRRPVEPLRPDPYARFRCTNETYRATTRVLRTVFSIPIYPALSDTEADEVIRACNGLDLG